VKRLAVAAVVLAATLVALAAYGATRPDPREQAVADGCGRDDAAAIQNRIPEWAYVGDRDSPTDGPPPPPQLLKGVVNANGARAYLATHVSGGDIPTTHRSHDVNVDVLPDAPYAALMGGDPAAATGNFEGEGGERGRVHTELETLALPSFAWPEPGDRVELLGSWVWDCGHWIPGGERTEIHPIRALWVVRRPSPRSPTGENEGDLFLTTDKTGAGKVADCAHKTRNDRAEFKACFGREPNWQDVTGRYEYFLPAPPRPGPRSRLTVRVVDAGSTSNAPALRLRSGPTGVAVSFEVPPTLSPAPRRLVVARRVLVGWTRSPRPLHLRVRLTSVLVRRKMDPACRISEPACPDAGQSTNLGQTTDGPGEWVLTWDVGGIWGEWSPRALLVRRDGQVFRSSRAVDLYVRPGAPWRLLVWGHECDYSALTAEDTGRPLAPCPPGRELGVRGGDDVPGAVLVRFRSPAASLGVHRADALRREDSTCPRSNRRGCYQVTFRVSRVLTR
jgi:hypothetical protein